MRCRNIEIDAVQIKCTEFGRCDDVIYTLVLEISRFGDGGCLNRYSCKHEIGLGKFVHGGFDTMNGARKERFFIFNTNWLISFSTNLNELRIVDHGFETEEIAEATLKREK